MKVLRIVLCITLLLLITGCASGNHDAAEENVPSSEPKDISSANTASAIKNDMDSTAESNTENKADNSMADMVQTIMNSEIAGYIGKTEKEIEAKYGPIQSEGEWYNGLLYTEHKDFSGSFGYGNADPDAVTESIESDSICNIIAFRLSEVTSASNNTFNKDELEFVYDESEGDSYYILKDMDVPMQINCDEKGNIEKDPWISIYF